MLTCSSWREKVREQFLLRSVLFRSWCKLRGCYNVSSSKQLWSNEQLPFWIISDFAKFFLYSLFFITKLFLKMIFLH